MKKIVYTDEFMHIVPQAQSKFCVTLQGSYYYCMTAKMYVYEVEKCEPPMPIKNIFAFEFLFENL